MGRRGIRHTREHSSKSRACSDSRDGRINRPKLGIAARSVKDIRDHIRLPVENGVIVLQVFPHSSAAAAGLRGLEESEDGYVIGDIITAIDGKPLSDSDDVARMLETHQIGDTVRIDILREKKRETVKVRLLSGEATGGRRDD